MQSRMLEKKPFDTNLNAKGINGLTKTVNRPKMRKTSQINNIRGDPQERNVTNTYVQKGKTKEY